MRGIQCLIFSQGIVLTVSMEILELAEFKASALVPLSMWEAWTRDGNA